MGLLYIIGGFLLFIAVGAMWNDTKLRRLRRERQGKDFSREHFIEAFRQIGIPDEIPAAVYDYYGSKKQLKSFPFSADDTYAEILHDDPEDIDEDAIILVGKLGMLIVPGHIRKEFGEEPIRSLRQMVLWLDWMRQRQPKSAGADR